MIIDYNLEYQIRNLELTLSHLYRKLDYLIVLERDIDEIDELKYEIECYENEYRNLTGALITQMLLQ